MAGFAGVHLISMSFMLFMGSRLYPKTNRSRPPNESKQNQIKPRKLLGFPWIPLAPNWDFSKDYSGKKYQIFSRVTLYLKSHNGLRLLPSPTRAGKARRSARPLENHIGLPITNNCLPAYSPSVWRSSLQTATAPAAAALESMCVFVRVIRALRFVIAWRF